MRRCTIPPQAQCATPSGHTCIFSESTLRLGTVRVKYLADDIAIVHARMTLSGQTRIGDARNPGVRTNIFTFVVKRIDGGWSCVAAHNTDVMPGMETNVVDETGRLKAADYRKQDK